MSENPPHQPSLLNDSISNGHPGQAGLIAPTAAKNQQMKRQDIFQERHLLRIKNTTPKAPQGVGDCGNRLP